MSMGKKEWFVPDGFMASSKNGKLVSHEAICVLNTGDKSARIDFTVYFEDREPLTGFSAECAARRTNHIRLDAVVNNEGVQIPRDVPYAVHITCSEPVVIQYSRMDVTQPEMALMTSIPYGV